MKKISSILLFSAILFGYDFHIPADIKRIAIDKASSYITHAAETVSTPRARIPSYGKHIKLPINTRNIFSSQNCDRVFQNKAILSCYDYTLKISRAVTYTLYGDDLRSGYIKKRPDFYYEPSIPSTYRAYPYDYNHSNFDRGHLRPHASSAFDYLLLRDTYSMVNIVPQLPDLNRKTWIKSEKYERLVAKKLGYVKVTLFVKFDNRRKIKRIGKHHIAVPDGFYRILENKNAGFRKCFFYSNIPPVNVRNDKLKHHLISCEKVYW